MLRRVVCRDMFAKFSVFGFTRHDITQRALNNDSQIVFRETGFRILATGASEAFVVRADPLQHPRPSSCVDAPDGAPCDDDDPETVAFCAAAECVADPVPEPAARLLGFAVLAVLACVAPRRRPIEGVW